MSRNSVTRPWTTAVNSTPGRLARDRETIVSSTMSRMRPTTSPTRRPLRSRRRPAPCRRGLLGPRRLPACVGLRCSRRGGPLQRAAHAKRRRAAGSRRGTGRRPGRRPARGRPWELLQTGHQRERDRHPAAVARGEQQHRLAVAGRLAGAGRLLDQRRSRTPETTCACWARPSTSRIRATLPSPMIVAPEKAPMPLSCFWSGLTTISSVSWIASTTSPN